MAEVGVKMALSLAQIAAVMGVVLLTVAILDIGRAQGAGLDARPDGTNGSRTVRDSAARSRWAQAVFQGGYYSGRGEQVHLHPGSDPGAGPGADRLRGHSLRAE